MGNTVAQISIYDAKTQLSALIKRVQAGETIEVTRYGQPVAWLVAPAQGRSRSVGILRGQIQMADDFDELDATTESDWYE